MKRKAFLTFPPIHFEKVDTEKFKSIPLCKWVALMGDVYPIVLVGADQVAVELFLDGKIGFLDIVSLVEEILSSVNFKEPESIEGILNAIQWAYEKGKELAGVKG